MSSNYNSDNISSNISNIVENASNNLQNLANNTTNKINKIGNDTLSNLQSASNQVRNFSQNIGNNLGYYITLITTLLCSPALVYLSISMTTLSSAFINGMDTSIFGVRFVKLILWTYCVNYLCNFGYNFIAWGIVMIPYILIPLQMLGVIQLPTSYLYLFLSQDEQQFFGV